MSNTQRPPEIKEHYLHLLLARLVALLGEHENATRVAHSRRGRDAKLKAGISVSGPPAGYIRDKDDGSWDFDIEEVQMAIRAVFATFLEQRPRSLLAHAGSA